ncbi:hypothetical protein [Dactylosporangium sp. CA-139066]|uniref:hypothetical protein n=1 Tax=Dactylosporangium sp. CA-139066 TaxID=3239930 RepID=UPI003D8E7FFB
MKLKVILPALAALLALAACSSDDANSHDIKGVAWKNPDKIEVYANVDGHPNITRVCIDGVAFATTSRDAGNNFMRVPEWDVSFCGGKPSPYVPRTAAPETDPSPTPKAN